MSYLIRWRCRRCNHLATISTRTMKEAREVVGAIVRGGDTITEDIKRVRPTRGRKVRRNKR